MRFARVALLSAAMLAGASHRLAAQNPCEGTGGGATIAGSPWTAVCVVAATSPDCVDSTGAPYECFQIAGTAADEPPGSTPYGAVAIFLSGPPQAGQTYPLGGGGANGAMVTPSPSGGLHVWITGLAPYVGQLNVSRYDSGSGIVECTFSFQAQDLFGGDPIDVTNGSFTGRIVAVEPGSWSDVKRIYR